MILAVAEALSPNKPNKTNLTQIDLWIEAQFGLDLGHPLAFIAGNK